MSRFKSVSACLWLAVAGLAACSGDSSGPDTTSPVATVEVLAPDSSVTLGSQLQVSVVLRGANGQRLADRQVTWTSSDTSVSAVRENDGLVSNYRSGIVTITATSEGKSGSMPLQVLTGLDIASIRINPDGRTMLVGSAVRLSVQAINSRNESQSFYDGATWNMLDPGVAAFDLGPGPLNRNTVLTTFDHPGTVRIEVQVDALSDIETYQVVHASWSSVSGGNLFSCGITTSHQGYCWGTGGWGEVNGAYPAEQAPTRLGGPATYDAISTGYMNACGLVAGAPWCWGRGPFAAGTIGAPVAIAGAAGFMSIAVGMTHACALKVAGEAWCWGEDWAGQLGNGPGEVTSAVAVPVSGGHLFTSLAAGTNHTCAIDLDASAWCWGQNASGKLGNGTLVACSPGASPYCSTIPVQVLGGHHFSSIAAGQEHSCALDADGAAWCWGSDDQGALGNAAEHADAAVPVAVDGGLHFTAITAGDSFTCALALDGQAWCWGSDNNGRLGTNGGPARQTPVAVLTTQRFVSLDAGGAHVCAVTAAGESWCWGSNDWNELGTGRLDNSPIPVKLPG